MSSLAPIAERLAKLIPLLGSSQTGEVVATARAIERLLRSCGADWHAFAALIETAAGVPDPRVTGTQKPDRPTPATAGPDRPAREAPRWQRLGLTRKLAWLALMERGGSDQAIDPAGLAHVRRHLETNPGVPLPPDQVRGLNASIETLWAAGIHP